MVRPTGRTSATRAEAYLPLAYFAIAVALVLAVLPSVLRPPPDQHTASAEFSPDAPPDENQESITAAFGRAVSGTAGGGEGAGVGDIVADTGAVPAPQAAPRSCTFGFGDPPRQTESLYAPPCAVPFQGDNGGATAKGVTATEVRVAAIPGPAQSGHRASYDGATPPSSPGPGESAQDRTWRVYQTYFNSRFRLYGRELRIFHVNAGGNTETQRAGVAKADIEYKVFAAFGSNAAMQDETVRRGLVAYGSYQAPQAWHAKHSPYAYSWNIDADRMMRLGMEMVCKQLVGRPPEFNERRDPTFDYTAPRRFGAIVFEDELRNNGVELIKTELAKCEGRVEEAVVYNLSTDDGSNRAANVATSITRMRAQGVTTIICACDFASPALLTRDASRNGYYPEWVSPGLGEADKNEFGRLFDPDQWRHSLGVTALEMARPDEQTDWYRAYKEIDPYNEPHRAIGQYHFFSLLQLMSGVQLAGPNLTPETFREGLQRRYPRRTPDPSWAVAGGYGPGDYTYPDYVSLTWWDPLAPDASSAGNPPGAYRHLLGGKRFAEGEIPAEPLGWFREGISEPA